MPLRAHAGSDGQWLHVQLTAAASTATAAPQGRKGLTLFVDTRWRDQVSWGAAMQIRTCSLGGAGTPAGEARDQWQRGGVHSYRRSRRRTATG